MHYKGFILSFGLLILFSLSACSLRSIPTIDSAIGTAVGAGVGAVAGALAGDSIGESSSAGTLGAIAGGGVGLLAGSTFYEKKMQAAEEQATIVREPILPTREQIEINAAVEAAHQKTMWGQGEVKSWEERYLDYEPNVPYQGRSPMYDR